MGLGGLILPLGYRISLQIALFHIITNQFKRIYFSTSAIHSNSQIFLKMWLCIPLSYFLFLLLNATWTKIGNNIQIGQKTLLWAGTFLCLFQDYSPFHQILPCAMRMLYLQMQLLCWTQFSLENLILIYILLWVSIWLLFCCKYFERACCLIFFK